MIIRTPGKQGKYFPTANAYQDALLTANFLSEVSIPQLLNGENYVVPKENASTYSDYFSLKFTEDSGLERTLFEFSNKVGAFITYVLIHAMNPRNEHIIKSDEKDLDRDTLVQEWTKNAVSSIIPFLLGKFKGAIFSDLDNIKPSDLDPKKVDDVIGDYFLRKPFFQMKAETITELDQKFEAIYPLVKYRLDEILKGLPVAIENYQMTQMMRIDHFQMLQKVENTCKHEFRAAKRKISLN